MDSEQLHKHIHSTYVSLRVGIGVIAFLLPLLLWGIGSLLKIELQTSMSAYYHTRMRDVFVGCLFAIGAFLYLYKGFSVQENQALNLAGLFAIGIALLPTHVPIDGTADFTSPRLHTVCAVSFFTLIAYVCWFRAEDTLKKMKNVKRRAMYRQTYRTLSGLMVLLPCAGAFLIFVLDKGRDYNESRVVFVIEMAAIWVFAAFWMIKGREIFITEKVDECVVDCG